MAFDECRGSYLMPLRKPTDDEQDGAQTASVAQTFPPEAYQYEAELKVEIVQTIQARADKVLCKEEWTVIDGVDKR
jgi:hypothetical protein